MSEATAVEVGTSLAGPEDVRGETREALAELLLALADDEFVLGYWDSEWTGIAPVLEEDVAYSSIAQDEIGHARALYELLAELTGRPADDIAYDRDPEGFRQARLLDLDRGDWAHSIARRYFYDTADAVRLAALSRSAYAPLANLLAKVRRGGGYHPQPLHAPPRPAGRQPGGTAKVDGRARAGLARHARPLHPAGQGGGVAPLRHPAALLLDAPRRVA